MESNINSKPKCIGFIMDGNRRFARSKNQPISQGFIAGKDKFIEVCSWVVEEKIPHAIFYAFSTENWKRSQEEVQQLLNVMLLDLRSTVKARIRVVGQIKDFPEAVQENIARHETESLQNSADTTVWIALSYGGRAEILQAVNKAIVHGEPVNEEQFTKYLWTDGMPDPDLIIRPGGERRLSGFLTWQSVYSELFFVTSLWPEFSKEEFLNIMDEYSERERRMGR